MAENTTNFKNIDNLKDIAQAMFSSMTSAGLNYGEILIVMTFLKDFYDGHRQSSVLSKTIAEFIVSFPCKENLAGQENLQEKLRNLAKTKQHLKIVDKDKEEKEHE